MAEGKKKYYDELNIFRAIVIVWVIIGHSFDAKADFWGFLHYYAYSFHMPAFFMLSGILFAPALERIKSVKDAGGLILKRFQRLMIPYFFLTAVSYVLKIFLERYAKNEISSNIIVNVLLGIKNPNGGLWFLFAMFWISILAIILCRVPSWINVIIGLVLIILSQQTVVLNYPIIKHIANYSLFFFLGEFISKYYDRISEYFKKLFEKRKTAAILLSCGLFMVSFALVYLQFAGIVKFYNYSFILLIFNTFCAYLLSHSIMQLKSLKKPFMTVGYYGMDIYMIGYYVQITLRVVLMSMLSLPYLAYALPMCVFGLLLPIPISKYIVRKFRITRALVLGDFKKDVKSNVKKA